MTSQDIHLDMINNKGIMTYKYMKHKCKYEIFFKLGQNVDQDIYHDTFIKFVSAFQKGFNNHDNLRGYFIRIYVNNLKTHYVRKVKHQATAMYDLPEVLDIKFEESTNLLQVNIDQLLAPLTDFNKQLLTLKYVQDFSDQEIAKEMNISYDNVRKYHYKAIKKLQKTLSTNYR